MALPVDSAFALLQFYLPCYNYGIGGSYNANIDDSK